jgi:hypothetical protein
MTTRKAGLPICQHINLGLQLLRIREELLESAVALSRAYPKNAKHVRQAQKAQETVDELRNQLDSLSAEENPADSWAPAIYYGANQEAWERDVLPILRRHREANPACCAGTPEPQR